jgi:hypothetical protein
MHVQAEDVSERLESAHLILESVDDEIGSSEQLPNLRIHPEEPGKARRGAGRALEPRTEPLDQGHRWHETSQRGGRARRDLETIRLNVDTEAGRDGRWKRISARPALRLDNDHRDQSRTEPGGRAFRDGPIGS